MYHEIKKIAREIKNLLKIYKKGVEMLDFFDIIDYNNKAFVSELRRSGGMADATDSKSVGSDTVWVQVPPSAPGNKRYQNGISYFFIQRKQSQK